ncbi:MAG: transglycosylase SLT domain-containing protein [Treponema sp.]|nr:transglycosylase SLT domain-containing protein [Treponema sp.]
MVKYSLAVFLLFSFYSISCARPQAQRDFYQGLSLKSNPEKISEAVSLFEKALSSPNTYIRQAAADELAGLMAAGAELSADSVKRMRSEVSLWWAGAFKALETRDKEVALECLLGFDRGAIPDDIKNYFLRECLKQGVIFDKPELAAVDGLAAVSRLRYNEALVFFRAFQEEGEWTARIPELFLRYPVLISDLGRAFQFSASGAQGLTLFLEWEKNVTDEDARFRLVFFAARIARRIGQNTQAVSLFEQALTLAPDTEQSDACIWYLLDLSLNRSSVVFIEQLEKYIPHWHNDSYFDDVLEKFLQVLTSKREWGNVTRVFGLIQNTGASIKTGYAYVIARCIEEGYFSENEIENAVISVGYESVDASVFMRMAYGAWDNDFSFALYYRMLSADVLGLPFLGIPAQERGSAKNSAPSPALQFLLGFFPDNAEFAPHYVRRLEQELTPGELCDVAYAFAGAGMYLESIRLVSRYINREGYEFNRRDLEAFFPNPYRELVEKYAEQTGISPALLFGLIRTESAFESKIVSRAGAVGLTQLMPETAKEMADRMRRGIGTDYTAGNASSGGLDLTNPEQNIHIGAYYFNYLMGRFDDTLLSLLAYNGGMNRVRRLRSASTLPVDLFLETVSLHETRDYGRKVMAAAAVYQELYYRN